MVRAIADFGSIQTESKKATKAMNDMEKNFSQKMGGMATATQGMAGGFSAAIMGLGATLAPATAGISVAVGAMVVATGAAFAAGTREAIKYETALTQLNFTLGKSAKGITDWGASQGSLVGMSETQVAQAGTQYSTLLSGFIADQATAAKLTQELIQQTAVMASRTGRTQEDVIERITSGLLGETEAVENLGIHVNVAMIESTKAFKDFAGDKSWEKLTFNQQQQIRLAAILEQSYRVGGKTLSDSTSSSLNKLKAEWNNLMLNIGQSILPVVKMLVDGLTWVIQKVNAVMKPIASFFNGMFGGKEPPFRNRTKAETKAMQEQAQAAIDLKDKIDGVKKAKKDSNTLFGFDQITQIAPKNNGDTGGTVGGTPSPFKDLITDLDNADKKVDAHKKKMEDLGKGMKTIGEGYNAFFKGDFSKAADKWAVGLGTVWGAITKKDKGVSLTMAMVSLKTAVEQLFKGDFKNAGKNFEIAINHYKDALFGKKGEKSRDIAGAIANIGKSFVKLVIPGNTIKNMRDLGKGITDFFKSIDFKSSTKNPFESWIKGFNNMIDGFNKLIGKLKAFKIGSYQPFKNLDYIKNIGPQPLPAAKNGQKFFAKGGVVTQRTNAVIGEDGAEVVMPLEKNTGWIDQLASKLNGQMGGGNGDIIIQIGGKEFGRVAISEINKANRVAGRNLIKV